MANYTRHIATRNSSIFRLSYSTVILGLVFLLLLRACSPITHEFLGSFSFAQEPINVEMLDDISVRSYVYASDGSTLATLRGPENRLPVSLAYVPQPVIDSILAIEDADFYNHGGVNFISTFRALTKNVSAGGVRQGGSTITQQLVKNALLTSDQNIGRKVKEASLAIELEKVLTKDQILEKYINTVYFGSGAYGVQAAAETYWGKNVTSLDWTEASLLAALISNPVLYDPILYPETAKKQRQIALQRLVDLGKITQEQATEFNQAPLPTVRCGQEPIDQDVLTERESIAIQDNDTGTTGLHVETGDTSCGLPALTPADSYFVEAVKQELLHDASYGLGATDLARYNQVFGGGLKIYTTLNPEAQQALETARDQILPENNKGVTAAAVSVEPGSGAVRALLGGPGFNAFKYDIATQQPGRQTGSAFKTFVLLTALEQGQVPSDTIEGGGSFPNPGGLPNPYKIKGPGGTLTTITTASSNGAYVRLGQIVGLKNVIALSQKLGITSDLDSGIISLPLGVKDTTPLEMATAYAAIPNNGVYTASYFIDRIEDRNGNVIYSHVVEESRAFSTKTACFANQILAENVRSGTGKRAALKNKQSAAGKTGTTEDHADAWFVGFTPYLSTAVWMGNPTERVSMINIGGRANFGGTYPAMLWSAFNSTYHESLPLKKFPTCGKTRAARQVKSPNDPKAPTTTTTTNKSSTTTSSTSSTAVPPTTAPIPVPTETTAPLETTTTTTGL